MLFKDISFCLYQDKYVQEGEVKKEEIKEENVYIKIKKEVLFPSTEEDTSTVYIKEEYVFIKMKMEVPSPSTGEDTSTVYIKEEYVEMANIKMTGNDK